MSKLPFTLTLVIFGAILAWVHLTPEPELPPKKKSPVKEKIRTVVLAPAARSSTPPPIHGFPDPRGVLLELRERTGLCQGSQFRSQSPSFVLWDDGTVVSMSATYDYRRSRVSIAQADAWSREFQSAAAGQTGITCDVLRDRSARGQIITLRGRMGEAGELTLSGPNLVSVDAAHLRSCADCGPLAPLAGLLQEIHQQRRQVEQSETLTAFPVEVYLEFRSCGCRNHPEIANVSKEWPLASEKPKERCEKGPVKFRLEDPAEIRSLSEAIVRSAAVLDRGEIYTCFMRPLLETPKDRMLAKR